MGAAYVAANASAGPTLRRPCVHVAGAVADPPTAFPHGGGILVWLHEVTGASVQTDAGSEPLSVHTSVIVRGETGDSPSFLIPFYQSILILLSFE